MLWYVDKDMEIWWVVLDDWKESSDELSGASSPTTCHTASKRLNRLFSVKASIRPPSVISGGPLRNCLVPPSFDNFLFNFVNWCDSSKQRALNKATKRRRRRKRRRSANRKWKRGTRNWMWHVRQYLFVFFPLSALIFFFFLFFRFVFVTRPTIRIVSKFEPTRILSVSLAHIKISFNEN